MLQRAGAPERFRVLNRTEATFPDETAALHLSARPEVLAEMKTIIEEGVKSGEFKSSIDRKLAVMTLFSSLNWMPQWYDPTSNINPIELGQQLADMLVNGLKK